MGYALQQSQTASPLLFQMVLATNHVDPAVGLSPTVTLSKNGAAFAAPAGAVSELGNGWYKVAGNATDTNTLGPLLLHATAGTADPSDEAFLVVQGVDGAGLLDLALAGHGTVGTVGQALRLARGYAAGKKVVDLSASPPTLKIYDLDGVTLLQTVDLTFATSTATQVPA